jgi:hypothetical protein
MDSETSGDDVEVQPAPKDVQPGDGAVGEQVDSDAERVQADVAAVGCMPTRLPAREFLETRHMFSFLYAAAGRMSPCSAAQPRCGRAIMSPSLFPLITNVSLLIPPWLVYSLCGVQCRLRPKLLNQQ